MLCNPLLVEYLQFIEHVDRVSHKKEDRRSRRRLFIGLFDQELDTVLSRLSRWWVEILSVVFRTIVSSCGKALCHLVSSPGKSAIGVDEGR